MTPETNKALSTVVRGSCFHSPLDTKRWTVNKFPRCSQHLGCSSGSWCKRLWRFLTNYSQVAPSTLPDFLAALSLVKLWAFFHSKIWPIFFCPTDSDRPVRSSRLFFPGKIESLVRVTLSLINYQLFSIQRFRRANRNSTDAETRLPKLKTQTCFYM